MQKEERLLGLIVTLVSILAIFSTSVTAEESFFYDSAVNFDLESTYSAGSNISTAFILSNNEEFSIADAVLSIHLVRGCSDPVYPSQNSDCDNIIDEVLIKDINLASNSNLVIPFSYNLPENLASGTYRLDSYLIARKTPLVGISGILLPGMYRSFQVNGVSSAKEVKILRTKTNINNQTGPIGVGVEKGSKVILNVFLDSNYAGTAQLSAKMYDWEDTSGKLISEQTIPISIKSGEQEFNIEMIAPDSTSAYPIRVELLDGNKLLSLYKSRIVVMGESAKIRKLYSDKVVYDSEKARVTVLVGSSPDHYTNPTTKNILLDVKLTNNDGKTYEKSESIAQLAAGEYSLKTLSFDVSNLRDYEICATINSGDEVYDSECYKVLAEKFHSNSNIIELQQSIKNGKFEGNLCVKDSVTLLPSKADVSVMATKNSEPIILEDRTINNCSSISFDFDQTAKYELRVFDKQAGKEKVFNISADSERSISKSTYLYIILIVLILILIIFTAIKLFNQRK